MARLLPSVVGLWYAVGSAVIPGLLLPMLGVYFPGLRVSPRWALVASTAAWAASTAWFFYGRFLGHVPLGIEPMFPGLVLSIGLWIWGKAR
jgi:SSS family solute:Na+ symporter